MNSYSVQASNCTGIVLVPGSKSHTIRAILFATLAEGRSIINNFLDSPDTWAMVEACRQFGATIEIHGSQFIIDGVNGQLKCPDDVIDAGDGNDIIIGDAQSTDDNQIDGGDGFDIVIFNGNSNNFVITVLDAANRIIQVGSNSDTLVNVEQLEFTDGTIVVDEFIEDTDPTSNLVTGTPGADRRLRSA